MRHNAGRHSLLFVLSFPSVSFILGRTLNSSSNKKESAKLYIILRGYQQSRKNKNVILKMIIGIRKHYRLITCGVFLFLALLHRIATAEELEALNAPYVRKYIRVSIMERLGFVIKELFSVSNICCIIHFIIKESNTAIIYRS